MKIAILTLPFNNNYGGYLQAYALMTILKYMGHEVELINRRPDEQHYTIIQKVKGWVKRYIFFRPGVYNTATRELAHKERGALMMPFCEKNIKPRTECIFSHSQMFTVVSRHYDAIVVGSDQVWRPAYVPYIQDFFLDFAKGWDIKRIAYAASFGTDDMEYSPQQQADCGELIKDFDAVSVREQGGVRLITDKYHWHTKTPVVQCLDPTMLLSKEHYVRFVKAKSHSSTLLCYILDDIEGKLPFLRKSAESLDCELDIINPNGRLISIEEWLTRICTARYVITDSFHGTVFSIIFNKPFVALGNIDRGSDRFVSLLDTLGLESRLVCTFSADGIASRLSQPIAWNEVNDRIKNEKEKSMLFLNIALQ